MTSEKGILLVSVYDELPYENVCFVDGRMIQPPHLLWIAAIGVGSQYARGKSLGNFKSI